MTFLDSSYSGSIISYFILFWASVLNLFKLYAYFQFRVYPYTALTFSLHFPYIVSFLYFSEIVSKTKPFNQFSFLCECTIVGVLRFVKILGVSTNIQESCRMIIVGYLLFLSDFRFLAFVSMIVQMRYMFAFVL